MRDALIRQLQLQIAIVLKVFVSGFLHVIVHTNREPFSVFENTHGGFEHLRLKEPTSVSSAVSLGLIDTTDQGFPIHL